ncbi:MAG: hypothetical protein JSW27_18580 [Phycisphaerales bacterium]|nr:MAG: hypothetical protein JSW27_18580 [Phycisphaerales bacterium]
MNRMTVFLLCGASFSIPFFGSPAQADHVGQPHAVARVKLDIAGRDEIRTAMYNYMAQVFQSYETMELVESDPQWTIKIVTLGAGDGEGRTMAMALSVVVLEHGPQLEMLRILTQAWHYILKAGLLDKDQPLAVGMRKLVASIDQLPETDDLTTLVQHRMCLIPVEQLGEACRDIVVGFDTRLLHSSGTNRGSVTEQTSRPERAVASP